VAVTVYSLLQKYRIAVHNRPGTAKHHSLLRQRDYWSLAATKSRILSCEEIRNIVLQNDAIPDFGSSDYLKFDLIFQMRSTQFPLRGWWGITAQLVFPGGLIIHTASDQFNRFIPRLLPAWIKIHPPIPSVYSWIYRWMPVYEISVLAFWVLCARDHIESKFVSDKLVWRHNESLQWSLTICHSLETQVEGHSYRLAAVGIPP
jgi:hypothetical protein